MACQKVRLNLVLSPKTRQKAYANDFSSEMMNKFIISMPPDVHFVFESSDRTVKVPAHKGLLAASSPVFNAMFNGELKENDEVKIVDATYEAFEEFLQFFYDKEVKLTMANIADVLNLVHKYDIAAGSKIVEKFLIETLTIYQTFWGLHLAVKFQLKELQVHCKKNMENDPTKVLKLLEFKTKDGGDKDDSVLSTTNHLLSETELATILPNILMVAKDIIFKQDEVIKDGNNYGLAISPELVESTPKITFGNLRPFN